MKISNYYLIIRNEQKLIYLYSILYTDNLVRKGSTPFITHLSSDQINVNTHDGVLKIYYLSIKFIIGIET